MNKVAPLAAIAAAIMLGGSAITGQAPAARDIVHSYAVSGGGASLPAALARVNPMLRLGELDIGGVQEDTLIPGRVEERLGQFYQGVPVFGGQVVRQIDGRSVISLTGRLYDGVGIGVTPDIPASRANEIVIQHSPPGANIHGETVLGVLPSDTGYRLVYRMDVRSYTTVREMYVDAGTGEIVRSVNGIQTATAVGQGTGVFGDLKKMSVNTAASTFQAVDGLRPASALTADFRGNITRLNFFLATGIILNSDIATDSDNVWTDGPTVDAHVYQGWVYDYYYKRFGRRGLDDRNLAVRSVVHPLARSEAATQPPDIVGDLINNAFYCCDGLMVYGDGDGRTFTYLAGALDVVGHEMTHGVTDFSSSLIYQDESGALNEAFSDIMGTAIEYYFQPAGSGIERGDWLIAEDVVLSNPRYLRSLSDPASTGHPDHYSLRRFIGTQTDDGGVHFNLTIATHAFYLAVAGGTNLVSGIAVTGVGLNNIERLERIFYRAFTSLMAPASTFSDARAATLQAATDLYGGNSNERRQVELAWMAVGVN